MYWHIFSSKYIAFDKPVKGACEFRFHYRSVLSDEQAKNDDKFDRNIQNKTHGRKSKSKGMANAVAEIDVFCAS